MISSAEMPFIQLCSAFDWFMPYISIYSLVQGKESSEWAEYLLLWIVYGSYIGYLMKPNFFQLFMPHKNNCIFTIFCHILQTYTIASTQSTMVTI